MHITYRIHGEAPEEEFPLLPLIELLRLLQFLQILHLLRHFVLLPPRLLPLGVPLVHVVHQHLVLPTVVIVLLLAN